MTRGTAFSSGTTGSSKAAASGSIAAAKPSAMPRARPMARRIARPSKAAVKVACRCGQIEPSANRPNATLATLARGAAGHPWRDGCRLVCHAPRMTRLRRRVMLGIGVLAVAGAAAAAFAANRASDGLLRFLLWDRLSPRAHGGGRVAVDGVSLYYETFGSGPPVLVMHGGLGSLLDMRNQIEALAPHHFVIAPDTRGHGRSTDSDQPPTYQAMADDMLGLLDHLGIRRVDIVGWSDGGIVGLALAMQHPDRVGRMVLIGANFDPSGLRGPPGPNAPIPPAPRLYRMLAPDPGHWPALFRGVTAMWRTQPHYTPAQLATIHAPTLVMAGEFDEVKRAHTDALAAAIPGAQEVILPGASHFALLTDPAPVDAHMLAFLDVR
jgi:pimeloyl-ACP methyl ester carboxylesterase